MSEEGEEIVALYALKGNRENTPQLSGSVITDARQSYSVDGVTPTVSMQMNTKGAKIWEEMTGNAYSQSSQIAIVLDDIVYSAPGVTSPYKLSISNELPKGDISLQILFSSFKTPSINILNFLNCRKKIINKQLF